MNPLQRTRSGPHNTNFAGTVSMGTKPLLYAQNVCRVASLGGGGGPTYAQAQRTTFTTYRLPTKPTSDLMQSGKWQPGTVDLFDLESQ